jgi:hypothetical protein
VRLPVEPAKSIGAASSALGPRVAGAVPSFQIIRRTSMPLTKLMVAAAASVLMLQAHAQASSTSPPPPPGAQVSKVEAPPKPVQAKCRNVPLQRSDAKATREEVVAELQRARREGELDWYISGNPPAVQRRPCLPVESGVGS